MSRVCRSLRDAVKSDELVWRNIIVEKPLSSRVCNNLLMKIASKSSGKLRTLVLINCGRITDEGLQQVVEQNPLINRLYLPGCTGLSPEGVIKAVRTLTKHQKTLEALQLSGIYNISKVHIEALQSCLHPKAHYHPQQPALFRNKTINFWAQNASASNLPIDVGICPRCDEVRMVFDCPRPREGCWRRRERWATNCRGCYFCIPRCEECGGCTGDNPGEAACEDVLCADCWLQLPKCSFCNKPYCKQHASRGHREISKSSSIGFVCDACHAEIIHGSRT